MARDTGRELKDGEALSPEGKRVLWQVSLTLLLDLISFSIIFPLFPAMLEYYREREGATGLFGGLNTLLDMLVGWAGSPVHDAGIIVLFGGILGSLYSLLQFVFAPMIGALTDRFGRKYVLVFCLSGILLSHALWIFASTFALLVIARVIGGAVSASITISSAIVSDVTTQRTRSKGMALMGIALGIGFTLGPAFGGIASFVDLSEIFPSLAQYGINPWSAAASVAFLLTAFNLTQVILFLPETKKARTESGLVQLTLDPRKLFRTEAYPGTSRTIFSYFIFLLAFSGIEFTLTFFAADRFGYSPADNAKLFLVIGAVLVLMQGGYVQRFSARIGLRRMAIHGFLCIIPGLICIALSGQLESELLVYAGVALLAAGAAQATPCLASLVSLYTPTEEHGRVLGVFRSLGALARAIGPLVACVIYWRLGSAMAYYLAALLMIAPILLARTLPEVSRKND